MDGPKARAIREKLGIRQHVLAWECQLDRALVSRWEAGIARLRPTQIEAIRSYLAQHLVAAKQEFAALALPELDADIKEVTR